MDPLSTGLGIAGFGLKLLGGIFGSNAADEAYEAQRKIYSEGLKIQGVKHDAMMLASRRQQLEIIRNGQRARALALNAATNQGAQFGSGLQGGYGQIAGATNTNLLGNQQSLEMGEKMWNYNSAISRLNLEVSGAQTDMANAQGIMSLGNSLIQSGPTIGNLFKGIF